MNHSRRYRLLAIAIASLSVLSTASARPYRRCIDRVASLDPVDSVTVCASRCIALVYETLLEYDYTARPYRLKPNLATALPVISDDGRTYTFTIDTNEIFMADPCFGRTPSGAPKSRAVTAEDFVYSFKRLADAKTPSSGYWLLEGSVEGIDAFHTASRSKAPTDYSIPVPGLSAPAPDTFVIRLRKPSPVFTWFLAMPYLSAVPHEAVETYGDDFREHPVGTGPYRLAKWRRNYSLRFARREEWRGWRTPEVLRDREQGLVPFDELLFPLMDDASTQWLAFLAGELDMQGEIGRDNWSEVVMADDSLNPKLEKMGIRISRIPTLEVSYIGLNMDDPVLGTNRFLRQALNAAFNASRWAEYYRGRALPSNGPVPPQVEGYRTNSLPFGRGIEVAKALLAKAGYPDGRDPTTGRRLRLTLDLGKTTQDMRESSELLVAFMDRCGIDLTTEYSSWPAFLNKISQRRSQMFRIAWVGDYPDAENFLQLFYGPNASPGPNRCNYSNPEFDRLYRQAVSTPDPKERLALYDQLQAIIQEDCPWIFISYATAASLYRADLLRYLPHDFPYGMEKHLRHRVDSQAK